MLSRFGLLLDTVVRIRKSESESYLLTFTKHIVQSISNTELQFLDYKVYRFTYFTGTREVLLQLRAIKHELIKVNTDLRTSCSVAHIICKKISSLERL